MKKLFLLASLVFSGFLGGYIKNGKMYNTDTDGFLKIGFDIDNTIIEVGETYQQAVKKSSSTNSNFYSIFNSLDAKYSKPIKEVVDLIQFYKKNGHDVFFITARNPRNGECLADYLTKLFGFTITVNENLFFAPEKKVDGYSETTKQKVIKKLKLDLFYGDSDKDIIAALAARVEPIRILRSKKAFKEHSKDYFGNIAEKDSFLSEQDYKKIKQKSVGLFGETIFPVGP